jgi:hypothetical protein
VFPANFFWNEVGKGGQARPMGKSFDATERDGCELSRRMIGEGAERVAESGDAVGKVAASLGDRPSRRRPVFRTNETDQLSFHSGIRPGVQGAPAASIAFSSFARSPSINARSRASTCSNSFDAAAYWSRCVWVGADVDMR